MTRIGQVKSVVREDGGNFVVVKWIRHDYIAKGAFRLLVSPGGILPKIGAYYAIEIEPGPKGRQHRLARRVLAP